MRAPKSNELTHEWHLVDVNEKILGRISSYIAELLMGKSKSNFVRNLDCGDFVVVINAKKVKTTGKREDKKEYFRHSGYPGGFRKETLKELRERKPEDIIKHAVRGMLPDNRLRDKMLGRLLIFPGSEHAYQDKFKVQKLKVKTEEEKV
jgi:large subunit ribosomal protein L13